MKKNIFFAILIILSLSCNKVDYTENDDFSMRIEVPIELQSGLTPNIGIVHVHELENVPTQINRYLKVNNITIDNIKGIYPRAANINSIYNDDLNFMFTINVLLSNHNSSTSSEGFYHPEIPNSTGSNLDLFENNQVNVLRYLKNPLMNLSFESRNDGSTNSTTEIKLRMDFGVQLIK